MTEPDENVRLHAELAWETINELAREQTAMGVVHAYMHVAGQAVEAALNTIDNELVAEGSPNDAASVLAYYWNEFARAIMPFHLAQPCEHDHTMITLPPCKCRGEDCFEKAHPELKPQRKCRRAPD